MVTAMTSSLAAVSGPILFPLHAAADDGILVGVSEDVSVVLPAGADRYAIALASYRRRVLRWALKNPSCIVSHVSAAALHGLPADAVALTTVHAILLGGSGNRRTRRVWRHVGRVADDEIVQAGPVRLTTAARSLADVARCEETWRAVALVDAALHLEVVTPAELRDAVGRIAGQPGSIRAAAAFSRADGRAESVGESRMRVTLQDVGLDGLELQFDVFGAAGEFLGRADAGIPGRGVLLEFDGDVKYTSLLRPGETAEDVRLRQERREAGLRAAGFVVVRVTWSDLSDPAALAARIREALIEGDRRVRSGAVRGHWMLRTPTVVG